MIAGRFFDGRTSAAQPAWLALGADRMVRLEGIAEPRYVPLASVRISDRIADIPRRVEFDDGATFETADNDAVDAALDALGAGGFGRRIVHWERRWAIAAAALAGVAIASWLFVQHGLPRLAAAAAQKVPPSLDAAIGSEGLVIMDRTLLAPSKLPAARQDELRSRLAAMSAPLADGHAYRLELRRGRGLGPNAFALPSGIIVLTDELVELAQHEDEIAAVLAHEIGHVRHRHALRMLLQDAGVAALAFAVLGDIGTASSLAVALPVVLVQAKHSRDMEREADAFARQWLREQGLAGSHFDAMMCRLAAGDDAVAYLSTHPPLAERADCARVR
ncbi:MAG: M48 family metallopeptidase [Steroidobacteraceae bacterium]|nr:M48 family metallopeptidase [Steroidobacteraceae bacterium]